MRYYIINEKRLKELLVAELATGYELEYNEELEYEDIAEKDLENFEFYKEDF